MSDKRYTGKFVGKRAPRVVEIDNYKAISIRIPPNLHEKIKQVLTILGMTQSEYFRYVIINDLTHRGYYNK